MTKVLIDGIEYVPKSEVAKTEQKAGELIYFTDSLGRAYMIDPLKVNAITIGYAIYQDENQEDQMSCQICIGSMFMDVNMDMHDLAGALGLIVK